MLQDVLQTVHDHKDEMLVLLTFGSVCVALLTALLAPAVQMHIARLNASTSILTASRVKWIETMQADIADLIATIERAEFLNKSMAEIRKQFPELNDGQQEEFN